MARRNGDPSNTRSSVGAHCPGRGVAAHARRNSRVAALVSDDRTKLKALARKYRIGGTFSYDDYDACLEQVDAVYIALPNSMHAEYTIRAARAGGTCSAKNRWRSRLTSANR